jgi:hypothetical protein
VRAGFVLVKKVPGSLHFMEHTDYFSFGLSGIDLTHTVHYLFFGARPPPYAYHQLLRLHPLGLNPDWLDKLKGKTYASPTIEHSHEHYLKVCEVVLVEGCAGRHVCTACAVCAVGVLRTSYAWSVARWCAGRSAAAAATTAAAAAAAPAGRAHDRAAAGPQGAAPG